MKPNLIPVPLNTVLEKSNLKPATSNIEVRGITHDHRKIEPGFIFTAIPGFKRHGIEFASDAISLGAVAVLTDSVGQKLAANGIEIILSEDVRHDMAILAKHIYQDAQSKFISIGVTGTNGKTTTTNLISSGLGVLEQNPLLIGTIGITLGEDSVSNNRTTPEATDLHAILLAAHQRGARSLVMEVSSHALTLGRVDGIKYDVSVFTGLTQDHLDFHADMNDYFAGKAKLFTSERSEVAVICIDDAWGLELAKTCEIPVVTYAISNPDADWQAIKTEVLSDGKTHFTARFKDKEVKVVLAIPGDFNIANSLAAIAVAEVLKMDLHKFASAFSEIKVPGRLERVESGQDFVALVDYAHTPDAVARAIQVARTCATGRVISVLGCGGDRDPHKRAPMGENAGQYSDLVIVTDDNPRSEDPSEIRAEVLRGLASTAAEVVEIANRLEAIHFAVKNANPGDCVIVLGKGHESGQEVNGVVTPFDDRIVLAEALRARMT
jgi:UDP-N-acetylmuramoyl-L-alanyl-D-glutamate--2,6-diaminopimelate ligase